ncbi:MAG: hypothetical protein U0667_06375 [Chloroflexota bacterium]
MRSSLLTLALVLVLPAAALAQSPSTTPAVGADHLREAVGFLPPDTYWLGFTDWSRIRASLGAQDVNGESPLDDKMAVVMSTVQQEGAAAGFGVAHLQGHHKTWGWDTLDVDWEATYSGDGPPVSLVRLREGVDVDAIAAHYDDYGFATEQVSDATLRTHDFGEDWIRFSDLGVVNTAFFDDGRTLMFSSSLEELRDAVRRVVRTPLPGQPQVVDALEGASAAWLVLAPDCGAFTPLPFDPLDPDASIRPLRSGEPLHPWTALGIGYARPDWDPVGRIAMGFLEPAHAEADLEPRATMARDGTSLVSQRPYADAVFALDGGRVEDTTLLLEVSPVGEMPRRLFGMLQARDMAFARC